MVNEEARRAQAMADHAMLEQLMETLLGKSLKDAERGDREDAYRRLARRMGVSSSTPRMWLSRTAAGHPLGRHLRSAVHAAFGKASHVFPEQLPPAVRPFFSPPPSLGTPSTPVAQDDAGEPDDLRYLLGRIRRLHAITRGRGQDFAMIERVVDLVESIVRARGTLT
jgi:hypothetical protein